MSINRSTLLEHVSSPSWPLSAKDWPYVHSNCMGFAFGLPIEVTNEMEFDEPGCISGKYQHKSIALSIIDVCKALKLHYRRIKTPCHANEDEYIIGGWGFYRYKVFDCTCYYDFHFIRRDLDGKWYHKPGWREPPQEIVSWQEDLHEWLEEGEPVYFAIKKEAP